MTESLDSTSTVAIDWPLHRRLAMVALGYIPFLISALVVVSVVLVFRRWGVAAAIGSGLILLYLFPPLACRITSLLFAPQSGRHPVSTGAFLRWWLSAQWQIIFNRLPMLEELLRLVPGLYGVWLRLWGAKIGSLVYWSPGVAVIDRAFLRIGNRVVLGSGARLNPHVMVPGKRGEAQLWLAPITLGDDVLVGGYCLIVAGCMVPSGLSVPAGKYVRPFSTWQDNQPAQSTSEGDAN